MIFLNYIPSKEQTQFAAKLAIVAAKLGLAADHLMAVIYKESGCNPQSVNSRSNATGIIQFMPNTAIWLGTTVYNLYRMTATQQLDYVEKYFTKLGLTGKLHDYTDVYLAIFFPAAIGKPENWVMQTSSLSSYTIATSNPGIDLNKDHQITVAEFRVYARNKMPNEVLEALKKKRS